MMEQLPDVVLPAGGRLHGAFAAEAGTATKALIRFEGETILERTIRVLRATGRVGRIVVVGPQELALHPASRTADAVLTEGDSGPENILRGMDWLRADGAESPRVLAMTTDLPFLTPLAVTDFLDACPSSAEVCVPILRAEEFRQRFPMSPATFARLGDGEWTIGCGFLMQPAAIRANQHSIRRAFDARKSEPAMARLLGLSFVLRFLTKRLRVEDIERRCCEILGCRGAAVRGAAPELAADIDTLDEYRYALRLQPFSK